MRPINSACPRSTCFAFVAYLMMVFPNVSANAATPAELLEKGIYTEETVGDLSAAIAVYEKVVSESKAAANPAAEAQFRIGVCYEKQGKKDLAMQAFKAVIADYPTAETLVRQAKSRINTDPELIAAPWGDGDEMQMELKLPTGMSVGVQVWRVAKSQLDNQSAWECNSWQIVTVNGQKSKSQVFADLETFSPIRSTWRHTLLGEAEASYVPDQVEIKAASKPDATKLKLEGKIFDNEQAAEVFRRLPLKVGYKSSLNVVSALGGALVPLELEVKTTESIEVPAGKFDCFRLDLNIGQTFWISNDENRYIVKFDAGGVSASLLSVKKLPGEERTSLETAGFTTELPGDWITYSPTTPESDNAHVTLLIDPLSELTSDIQVATLASIKASHDSPVAWLQSHLESVQKQTAGSKTITGTVRAIQVDGHDAAELQIEFKEGTETIKGRRIAAFGDSSAVTIRYQAQQDAFERWTPAINDIVKQLKLK